MAEARWLSAKYREDFAYPTVKDRIPIILTQIVDQLYRMKADAKETYGEEVLEDLKQVVGAFSKLKNEIQTNKPIIPVSSDWPDKDVWNNFLQEETARTDDEKGPAWFVSPWLYVECYFYRRIHDAFLSSCKLKEFDPFGAQKREAFLQSKPALAGLGSFLLEVTSPGYTQQSAQQLVNMLLQVALWGNKCDLSISAGAENHQKADPLTALNHLRENILIDQSNNVWDLLSNLKPSSRLDIVLDNAGFELFTDLCLAEYFISSKMVTKVMLYPKAMPWFVSDVTRTDLEWTLEELEASSSDALKALGKRFRGRFNSGEFAVNVHPFWTYPHDFSRMKEVAPDLYQQLFLADLILFKGDLNYRKLVRDRKWEPTTAFETALGGFNPAPLCSLRTLKADVVVGLEPGKAEEIQLMSEKWMVSGEYGVIQFTDKRLQ